jgi:hypothetical protein
MERVPLYQLIELCKQGNMEAKKEYKNRSGYDWDSLREEVESLEKATCK